MNDFQKNGGDWTMGGLFGKSNECADYAVGMLDAAGIKHPNFKTFGKTDPNKLAKWLKKQNKKNK
ncbi:MAG: hypothetical protein Q8R31_00815 [Candidatus Omnitrophota bacterium]|nr:hypothetical protein [Candidatus Omnitrophota bacterium]